MTELSRVERCYFFPELTLCLHPEAKLGAIGATVLLALECLQYANLLAQRYRLGLCLIPVGLQGPWLKQLVDHFTHTVQFARRCTADGLFQFIHIGIVGSLCLQLWITHCHRRALLAFLYCVKLSLLGGHGGGLSWLSLIGLEAALTIAIGLLHGEVNKVDQREVNLVEQQFRSRQSPSDKRAH